MQTEFNVEKDDVTVKYIVEVGVVVVTNVMKSVGGSNVELSGSGISSNSNLVNDEKRVSSRSEFDDDI